ncbi:MAG TPA: hypothetical protein PJ993_03255 [Candidatus Saccharibacteria bacterium]|nr:hypothetical protein [Candidatus Saccharibacteria bacterium]HMT39919.1 hypothetical protein [Candidatus Saccharibacteria bacterium]
MSPEELSEPNTEQKNVPYVESPLQGMRDMRIEIFDGAVPSPDYYAQDLLLVSDLEDGIKSTEELTATMKERILEDVWWLNPDVQQAIKNGRLKEKVTFQVRDKQMDFYCFDEALTQEQITEISHVLEQLVQVQEGLGFDVVSEVLVGKNLLEDVHTKDGKKISPAKVGGAASVNMHLVYINTAVSAVEKEKRRGKLLFKKTESFTKLAGVFAHELGHQFEKTIDESLWLENHGWKVDGILQKTIQKVKRVYGLFGPTVYAGKSPDEDFAESFARFLLDPSRLDSDRREFMIKELLSPGPASQPIDARPRAEIHRTEGSAIVLPRMKDRPVYVAIDKIS